MTERFICLYCDADLADDEEWFAHLKSEGHAAAMRMVELPPQFIDEETLWLNDVGERSES
jgi:hypothetical protein